jgi:hypothetical protein
MNKVTIILVGADRLIKYESAHDFFVSNAHLGYSTLTTETLNRLPDDIYKTMQEAPPIPLVYLYVAGNA